MGSFIDMRYQANFLSSLAAEKMDLAAFVLIALKWSYEQIA